MIPAPSSTAPALAPQAARLRWSISDFFSGTRLVQRLGASFAAPLVLMLGAAPVTGLQLKRIDAANAQMDSDRKRMAVVSEWMGSVRGNLDRAVLATRLDAAIADDEPTRQRLLAPVGRLNEAMAAEASAAAKAQQQMNDSAAPGEDDIRALVADVGKHRERFVATRAKIRDDLLLGGFIYPAQADDFDGGDGVVCHLSRFQKWRQRLPRCTFLLVTGDTRPDVIRRASDAGIATLHKPVSVERLNEKLKSMGIGA